jgi:hypothetical protein
MTDAEALALGRRMSACAARSRLKGWPNGLRFLGTDEDGKPDGRDGIVVPGGYLEDDQVRDNYERQLCGRVAVNNPPDLRDPATAGLLPMLVREALGSEHIVAQWNGFLGRTWDPDVDDPDNDRDAVARDNLRQWQIREQVAGGRVLGAGATRIDAWLAAWETAR